MECIEPIQQAVRSKGVTLSLFGRWQLMAEEVARKSRQSAHPLIKLGEQLVVNPKLGQQVVAIAIDTEVAKLVLDDDVTKKTGIYPYILTRKEKYLSIRAFTDAQKLAAYERQHGICADCGEHFELSQMEADHITPWHDGGRTVAENCQMLCRECNRRKSGR